MNVRASRVSSAIVLGTSILLTGCKPDKAVEHSSVIDSGTKPVTSQARVGEAVTTNPMTANVDATKLGTISGVVSITGMSTGVPPMRVPIDMSMDPACAMTGGKNFSEQYVISGDKLANVYVYVKGVTPSNAPAGQPPVVLDQKGCKYVPHVIAVQQGGSVKFTNSDPTMHNVHTMPKANAPTDVSEGPMGQSQIKEFDKPEVMVPVRCNNHPWMNAFINVADSPYFAVTGTDGRFEIKGLPAGTYTLGAVHEKLGEQDIQVTVAPKATAKTGFTFKAK